MRIGNVRVNLPARHFRGISVNIAFDPDSRIAHMKHLAPQSRRASSVGRSQATATFYHCVYTEKTPPPYTRRHTHTHTSSIASHLIYSFISQNISDESLMFSSPIYMAHQYSIFAKLLIFLLYSVTIRPDKVVHKVVSSTILTSMMSDVVMGYFFE